MPKLLFVDDARGLRDIMSEYFGTPYEGRTAADAAAARIAIRAAA